MSWLGLGNLALGFAAVAACTPAPNAESSSRTARIVPSGVATAPTSAASADAAKAVAPNAPPGANAEHVALLANLCAMGVVHREGRVLVGCASHPPFVSPEQLPRERVVDLDEDRMRLCEIVAVHRGSFSRPGAEEAVIAFGECYDAGDSFERGANDSESVVLLEHVAGTWRYRAHEENVHGSRCWVRKDPAGVDGLLCRSGLVAPGAGAIEYLFSLDFQAREKRARTVARMYSHAIACATVPDYGPRVPHGLVSLQVGEGHMNEAGFSLEVTRGRLPHSAALEAKVRAECRKNPDTGGAEIARRTQRAVLKFVPRGASFEPDAATATLLAQWESESPDAAGEMRGAAP